MNESINSLLSENRELAKAKQEAEDTLQAKSRFLSVMSHEIRSPVNAIAGLSALLLENPRHDQEEYLQLLKFSADNLLVIINDILSLGKIEEGMVQLEQVDFNLHQTLENICNINKPAATQKDIGIRLKYDPQLPEFIKGDVVRLGQVIGNLVTNAIKFTTTGEVLITATCQKTGDHNLEIKFEVSDTGIGIPEDKHEHIFGIFTQAAADTTRKFGGIGLGLAISRKLVTLMGSELKLRSKPGEGSKFYFTANLLKSDQGATTANNPADQNKHNELAGLKILLAEDNPINVLVMKRYSGQWNVDCDVAENGKIAVEKTTANNYDLVLMDLHMPEMDGFEAAREIRNMHGDKSATPIVAVTASLEGDIWSSIREAGIDDFLTKPFKADELYQKLKKFSPDNIIQRIA